METLPSELYGEIVKFVDDQNIRLVNQLFKRTYDSYYTENGVTLTITKTMFLKYAIEVDNFKIPCINSNSSSCYWTFGDFSRVCYKIREMSKDHKKFVNALGTMGFIKNINFLDPHQEKIFNIYRVYLPDFHCVKYFLTKHYLVHSQNNTFIEKSLENTYELYNNFIKWMLDNAGVNTAEFDKFSLAVFFLF
jgi:hypothetical protein